jgi:hypothetical protein
VEVYAAHLACVGSDADARTSILEFLGWEEPDEDRFAQDVRIVLASAEFSKELTTAVMWLNDRGLDIRCVRLKPHPRQLPRADQRLRTTSEVREQTARKE